MNETRVIIYEEGKLEKAMSECKNAKLQKLKP